MGTNPVNALDSGLIANATARILSFSGIFFPLGLAFQLCVTADNG